MLSVSERRPLSEMLTQDWHSDQVKKAEIEVAAVIINHNLPFHVTDHLSASYLLKTHNFVARGPKPTAWSGM